MNCPIPCPTVAKSDNSLQITATSSRLTASSTRSCEMNPRSSKLRPIRRPADVCKIRFVRAGVFMFRHRNGRPSHCHCSIHCEGIPHGETQFSLSLYLFYERTAIEFLRSPSPRPPPPRRGVPRSVPPSLKRERGERQNTEHFASEEDAY